MSYQPTPPPPPPPPSPAGPGLGTGPRRDLWLGVGVGLLVSLAPGAVAVLGGRIGFLAAALITPLVVFVVGVVLTIFDRLRRWGLGLLVGFFTSLVVTAGTCVLILLSWNAGTA